MIAVITPEKVASPATPSQPSSKHPLDAYPYGWRHVRRIMNGEEEWERVPLTREDLLHPQLGDTKVHNEYHERFSTYLYDVLVQQVADDPQAVVLHDVGIVWDDPDLEHHAPDIAVIFNVRKRQEWSTFNVAKEGTKPTLIIEVTSLSNRSTDITDKLDEYEQAGVPMYVIVDTYRYKGKITRRLLGYELSSNGHYNAISRNEKDWLWVAPVNLWLVLDDNQVVWYDELEQPIADYTGVVKQRNAAKAEVQKAKAKIQAEIESRMAAEAKAQAEAEARAEMEAELARLRAELARFRGTSVEQ